MNDLNKRATRKPDVPKDSSQVAGDTAEYIEP